MELVEVLHMNGGVGETSYAENSVVQRKLIAMAKPLKESAVKALYGSVFAAPGNAVAIADLGCSTGPNALLVAHELISSVDRIRRDSGHLGWSPEFQVFLNDLPGNDFNAIFRALPGFHQQLRDELGSGFGSCFVNGVPGSFYGRLFPSRSLHFVHSSSSLHWLSQVPEGIERSTGKSPESVGKAYYEQFSRDFSTFLKCRSEELVTGGCMVFTLHGRKKENPPNYEFCFSSTWELLGIVLAQMTSEGLIEEEKMDTFNRPLYAPSWAEIENEVKKEGSFTISHMKSFEVSSWDIGDDKDKEAGESNNLERRIRYIVVSTRSGMESFLLSHFGDGLSIDEVFKRYERIVRECMTEEMTRLFMFTVSLTKTS